MHGIALAIVGLLIAALLVAVPLIEIPRIEAKINLAAAQALAEGGQQWASTETDEHVVTISGTAASADEVATAEALVLAVDGVDEVVSEAVVEPYRTYAMVIKRAPDLMRITGEVPDQDFADRVVEMAREAVGTDAVEHELTVAPGRPFPEHEEIVGLLIAQAAALLEGEIVIANNGIVAEGLSIDQRTNAAIEEAFADYSGLVTVRANVQVSPPRVFPLTIERSAAMLELSGEVPNAEERNRLMELARRQASGVQVVDRLVVVPGNVMEGWQDLTDLMVRQFGSLDTGIAELTGTELRVTGVVADPMMADIVRSALESAFQQPGAAIVPVVANIGTAEEIGATAPRNNDAMFELARTLPIPDIAEADRTNAEGCQAALSELTLAADDTFVEDSDILLPAASERLDEVALALRRCPDDTQVQISGHVDATEDQARDQSVSDAWSDTVLAYLNLRGVPSERIIAVGYGADIPIADNTSADGRATNRRIEFQVLP